MVISDPRPTPGACPRFSDFVYPEAEGDGIYLRLAKGEGGSFLGDPQMIINANTRCLPPVCGDTPMPALAPACRRMSRDPARRSVVA